MKDRNYTIYFATIIVVCITYFAIYLYGVTLKKNFYQENEQYQNNLPKQPVNNIYSIEGKEEEPNNGKGTKVNEFIISYDYDEDNYIDLYNQFPTLDEVGMNFTGNKYTHDFKLKLGKTATGISYSITLKKEAISDLPEDWVKVYLVADGEGVSNSFRASGRVKTFNEYPSYNDNDEEKILYSGIINYQEVIRGYKSFTLRMWVSEDVKVFNEDYLEKYFKAKVTVYAERKI